MHATRRRMKRNRAEPFYPWHKRQASYATPIVPVRGEGWYGRTYNRMSDGSLRRRTGDRLDRRELGLSPRQYRKAKREAE